MKQTRLLNIVLLSLSLIITVVPASTRAESLPTRPTAVKSLVDRHDLPVASGAVRRSWTWGEYFAAESEPYREALGGARVVFYHDKGRLEITNSQADPAGEYYATSGLLLREMITGQVQMGDNTFVAREPANVVLAGDNPPLVDTAPTYADLQELVSFDGNWKSSNLTGQIAGLFLARGGTVDSSFITVSQVKYVQYDPNTGHNIADVFLKFMNSSGLIYNGKELVTAPLYNPLYVFGRPISEPYWTLVTVAGAKRAVLVQAFERRLLTYTPENSPDFQVELGNIGRAYYQWRYSSPGTPPAPDPVTAITTPTPALEFYTNTLKNLNNLKSMRLSESRGSQRLRVIEFEAPNKRYFSELDTLNCGKDGYYTEIVIEQRLYVNCLVKDTPIAAWVYVDLSKPFRWPAYSGEVNLNELDLDYSFGPDGKVGNEPTRSIIKKKMDNQGYNLSSIVNISTASGLPLEGSTTYEFKEQLIVNNVKYDSFNESLNIQPPNAAKPLNPSQVNSSPVTNVTEISIPSVLFSEVEELAPQIEKKLNPWRSEAVPGEIIVKFKTAQWKTGMAKAESLSSDFSWKGHLESSGTVVLQGNPVSTVILLEKLKAQPEVEYAEPNYLYYPTALRDPNDEQYSKQWYLKAVKATRAWSITTGQYHNAPGSDQEQVLVAIIDTGVQANHADLAASIVNSFDLADGRYAREDPVGHGTLVAGIISAQGNNNSFGVGLAWRTKLLNYRVGDRRGISCQASANAIHDAADRGVRVINLSFGNSVTCQTLGDAIIYAQQKRVIIVAAAGNEGSDKPYYPSAYPGVIAVAAVGKLGLPTSFSNYGTALTLVAPGVDICNTTSTGPFGCDNGTSFSAPIVTGTIALMLSVNPRLSPAEVKAILLGTALPAPGKAQGIYDPHYGYGTLNTFAAVRAVATNQSFKLPAEAG